MTGEEWVPSVWYRDDEPRLLLIEVFAPKRFRRVWLDEPAKSDDFTWHLPEDAVFVGGREP